MCQPESLDPVMPKEFRKAYRGHFFFFNENMTGFGSRTGMENGKSRKTKITRQELADG